MTEALTREIPAVSEAFYCERKHLCRWQCFALHQGLGWGPIPPSTNPWRVWHDKECGGRLLRLIAEPRAGGREGSR